MGLVPKEVRGKVGLGEVKLVLATAKILAKAGSSRDMIMGREERRAAEMGARARHHREEGRGEEEGMEGGTVGEGARAAQDGT